MAKKLGFALGAGGSRGIAHIGFLKAMEENGIKADFVAGASMGSVVGSCYCLGMNADQMMEEINKLKFSDIFDLSINPFGNGALLRAKKMRKRLEVYLKKHRYEDTLIPFRSVATDLISGETIVMKGRDKLIDGIVASSSIPGVFKPVEWHGKVLVDGGIMCRVPVEQVREMGAEVVVAVDVLGQTGECDKRYNMFTVLYRMVDIMDSELALLKRKYQKPNVYIEPDLGDMSQFKFKDLDKAYQKGYEIGLKNVKKIKRLIQD